MFTAPIFAPINCSHDLPFRLFNHWHDPTAKDADGSARGRYISNASLAILVGVSSEKSDSPSS